MEPTLQSASAVTVNYNSGDLRIDNIPAALVQPLSKNGYGQYLKRLLKEEVRG
jgi:hypothetical protein